MTRMKSLLKQLRRLKQEIYDEWLETAPIEELARSFDTSIYDPIPPRIKLTPEQARVKLRKQERAKKKRQRERWQKEDPVRWRQYLDKINARRKVARARAKNNPQ